MERFVGASAKSFLFVFQIAPLETCKLWKFNVRGAQREREGESSELQVGYQSEMVLTAREGVLS